MDEKEERRLAPIPLGVGELLDDAIVELVDVNEGRLVGVEVATSVDRSTDDEVLSVDGELVGVSDIEIITDVELTTVEDGDTSDAEEATDEELVTIEVDDVSGVAEVADELEMVVSTEDVLSREDEEVVVELSTMEELCTVEESTFDELRPADELWTRDDVDDSMLDEVIVEETELGELRVDEDTADEGMTVGTTELEVVDRVVPGSPNVEPAHVAPKEGPQRASVDTLIADEGDGTTPADEDRVLVRSVEDARVEVDRIDED
ncbi:hypothetical protein G6011_08087 [Alternaria panax]|uniref:Uncharacterized protein n=1 Tax=Alternaria panax TaxID=48097 RepID=A0AAD4FGC4_9PLEO|nr:hypothetical protein G6011_08087 [Alternaria panax]